MHREIQQLAIALDRDLDRLVLGLLQAFDHGREAGNGLPVHVDNFVAQLHSGLFGRHAGLEVGDREARFLRRPSRGTHLVRTEGLRDDGLGKYLAVALDADIERLVRIQGLSRNSCSQVGFWMPSMRTMRSPT